MAIDHDNLYKELITNFFKEFMEGFFPEVSEYIDYSYLDFLEQETYDVKTEEKRRIDILAKTKVYGEEGYVLVHVEPQSQKQGDFNERMFRYYCNLYLKHRLKILPVAVLAHDIKKDEPDNFNIDFPFFNVLDFNFMQLCLKKLDWKEYLRKENPAVAALMSKMDYTEEEKKQVKKEFLRMMLKLEIDEGRMEILTTFMDTYIGLEPEQEEEIKEELSEELPPGEVSKLEKLVTSWEKRGREERDKEIVKQMIQKGYGTDEIVEITGLSKEKIENIRKEGK